MYGSTQSHLLTDFQLEKLVGFEVEAIYYRGGSRLHVGVLKKITPCKFLWFWPNGWYLTFADGDRIHVLPEDDVNRY